MEEAVPQRDDRERRAVERLREAGPGGSRPLGYPFHDAFERRSDPDGGRGEPLVVAHPINGRRISTSHAARARAWSAIATHAGSWPDGNRRLARTPGNGLQVELDEPVGRLLRDSDLLGQRRDRLHERRLRPVSM